MYLKINKNALIILLFFFNSDLRNNRLEEIDDDAFDGAESLYELYEILKIIFK